jgi:hypothetical protein
VAILVQVGFPVNAVLGQGVTIPVSDKYFMGEIVFEDESKVDFELREGALLTMTESTAATEAVGLVLYLSKGSGQVKVQELHIKLSGTDEGSISGMKKPSEIGMGSTLELKGSPVIRLSLNKLGEGRYPNPPLNLGNQAGYLNERCCVQCKKRQICATSISTSCGKCRFDGR